MFDYRTVTGLPVKIDQDPTECPICHKGIHSKFYCCYLTKSDKLRIFYNCPTCDEMFIAYYNKDSLTVGNIHYHYIYSLPKQIAPKEFSEQINDISVEFVEIFNQSKAAEEYRLMQIAGMGYRKALEFLIKKYLIKHYNKSEDDVSKMKMQQCIEQIKDQNLKACAERAIWLGNDETHYVRKWDDKDIKDLKILIDLAIKHMESELLTKKYIEEMKGK